MTLRFFLTALSLLAVAPGCVRYDYQREIVNEPIADQRFEQLAAGMDLKDCLEQLGAPGYVWTDQRGVWLAYIWIQEKRPRIAVSLPFLSLGLPGSSPSFSYARVKRRGEGITLCFDQDLVLRFARRGLTDLPETLPG
jgi:hypothetical protein